MVAERARWVQRARAGGARLGGEVARRAAPLQCASAPTCVRARCLLRRRRLRRCCRCSCGSRRNGGAACSRRCVACVLRRAARAWAAPLRSRATTRTSSRRAALRAAARMQPARSASASPSRCCALQATPRAWCAATARRRQRRCIANQRRCSRGRRGCAAEAPCGKPQRRHRLRGWACACNAALPRVSRRARRRHRVR